MIVRPAGNRILVEAVEFDMNSPIIDVQLQKEAPDRGVIISFGDELEVDEDAKIVGWVDEHGVQHTAPRFIGEVILFGKYSGIPCDGDLHLIRVSDVIASVEGATIKEKKRFDAMGVPQAAESSIVIP